MKTTFHFDGGVFSRLLGKAEKDQRLEVAIAALEQWQRYCFIPEGMDWEEKARYVVREYEKAKKLNEAALKVFYGS